MKHEYETIPTRWTMKRKGEPIYDEYGFTIEIADEAGGGYIIVQSHSDDGEIKIDIDEWPHLVDTISQVITECQKYNDETKNV